MKQVFSYLDFTTEQSLASPAQCGQSAFLSFEFLQYHFLK